MKYSAIILKHRWLVDEKGQSVYLTKNLKNNNIIVMNMLDITKEQTQIFKHKEIEDYKAQFKTDFSDFKEIPINVKK